MTTKQRHLSELSGFRAHCAPLCARRRRLDLLGTVQFVSRYVGSTSAVIAKFPGISRFNLDVIERHLGTVGRLQLVVWKTVNMMSVEPDVRDDAFAATWLRLAERLDTIREPDKLPGWSATTAANEVRQIRRQRRRLTVGLTSTTFDRVGRHESLTIGSSESTGALDPTDRVVSSDERRRVRLAFRLLDPGCQEVLSVLVMTGEPV